MRRRLLASCLVILATAAGIVAIGGASSRVSSAAGTWTKVASLVQGRTKHTATLLRNGNVLIAGGTDVRGKALGSVEIYDPRTNGVMPVASMATARLDHTATLLPSGEVLVIGGFDAPLPSSSLASAEVYDPTINGWSSMAPMTGSRARHTATLLPDGRVLVVGGISVTSREGGFFPSRPAPAEIYDRQSNRWSTPAPMGFSPYEQTVTLLRDGRVLVAGGSGDAGSLKSAEIYSATEDRWISAAPMSVARSRHVAALLPDGDVFVAGGIDAGPTSPPIALNSGEIYDPRTNLWVTVAGMADLVGVYAATLLRNGTVLVMGIGQSQPEIYDPARGAWSRTGPSMRGHVATSTLLPDGRVVLVEYNPFDSVVVYDPNGVTRVPRRTLDPRLIGGAVVAALLLLGGAALSFPAVRRRLKALRPPDHPEEWIT